MILADSDCHLMSRKATWAGWQVWLNKDSDLKRPLAGLLQEHLVELQLDWAVGQCGRSDPDILAAFREAHILHKRLKIDAGGNAYGQLLFHHAEYAVQQELTSIHGCHPLLCIEVYACLTCLHMHVLVCLCPYVHVCACKGER